MRNRSSMGRWLIAAGWFCLAASAQAAPLGNKIAATPGGSKMLVNAGNAIQSTCAPLGASNQIQTLQGQQQDLFFRCNEMLSTFDVAPGTNPSVNSYGYENSASGLNAVRQFSGEEASSQRRLGKQGDNLQFAGIGARMDAIRQGARGAGSGIAMNLDGTNLLQSPTSDAAPVVSQFGGAAGDEDADLGWAWFANMNVGYANHDRSPREDGFDSDFYGGTLGVDYAFTNGLVLGIAGGYQDYSANVDGGGNPTTANPAAPTAGGEINADSYTVSGYALLSSDVYFMSAIVSYGSADYNLQRKAIFLPGPNAQGRAAAPGFSIDRTYHGDTSSDQVGAELTLGADVISSGPWSVEGYAKLDYLSSHIDGYTEKERDNTNSTQTPGLALKYWARTSMSPNRASALRFDAPSTPESACWYRFSVPSGAISGTAEPAWSSTRMRSPFPRCLAAISILPARLTTPTKRMALAPQGFRCSSRRTSLPSCNTRV